MNKMTHGTLSLTPKFILEDRNGYALAAAIDRATGQFARDVERADALICDPETMPEWALDEYAYANGLTWYDKSADIETKRRWAMDAPTMRRCVGTKEALRRLMLGFYDYCAVEEGYAYGGKAYEFRVVVSGDTSEALEEWAIRAIYGVKNLRSVFAAFAHGHRDAIAIGTRDAFYLTVHGVCGEMECGVHPYETTQALYAPGALALHAKHAMHTADYPAATAEGHDAGETADAGLHNAGMQTGDLWTLGESELALCGDADAL